MKQIKPNAILPLTALETERGGAVRFFGRIAAGFAFLFSLAILFVNVETVVAKENVYMTLLLAGLCLLAAVGLSLFKFDKRATLAFILILGFALRFGLTLALDAPPLQDFQLYYDAAQSVLNGDTSCFDNYFYKLYPNIIPIVYFYAGLFSLDNAILFANVVNILMMTASIALVYGIADELFGQRAACFAGLIYAICPSVIEKAPQLTNQNIALFLFLLGLYLLLKRQTLLSTVLCAVSIAIGDAFRSEAIVIHAALAVWMLLLLLDSLASRRLNAHSRHGWKRLLLTAVYFATIYLVGLGLSFGFTRLSGHSVSSDSSFQWKFIVGLNDEESGTYSSEDLPEFMETGDGLTIIRRRIESQKNWPDFLYRKVSTHWSQPEEITFSFGHLDPNARVRIGKIDMDVRGALRRGQILNRAVYLVILVTFVTGSFLIFTDGRLRPRELFLLLIFDAYFCAYLLIEIGARYRYFILPFMIILGSRTICALTKKEGGR